MKSYDVCIVGAGPAGVSCAMWLKQLGFNVLMIDKNTSCGGLQLSNPYTNTWIATSANVTGQDVVQAMNDNVKRHKIDTCLGVSALRSSVNDDGTFETALDNGLIVYSRFLVLAGGVAPKSGGLAARAGIIIGPGPKVATTDFSKLNVAILGGGDSAFENYHFVKERGAARVTIFARTLRARLQMRESVPESCVVEGDYRVEQDGAVINGIRFDQTLVMYGYESSRSATLGLSVALRPDGFVMTDMVCLTSVKNVFAIGEIAQRGHPCCVTAMADGIVAAKAIQRMIERDTSSMLIGAAGRLIGAVANVLG